MAQMAKTIGEMVKEITATPTNNTVSNHLYLLDIIKDELGITDDDVKYLSKDELKQKIRNNKLNKLK